MEVEMFCGLQNFTQLSICVYVLFSTKLEVLNSFFLLYIYLIAFITS